MAPACRRFGNGDGQVATQAPLRHLIAFQSQNRTMAASAIAEKNVSGQRSYRVATRLQSFSRPNMISMRLRRLYLRLSYLTAFLRDFRPGMQTFIPLSFNASLSQSALAGSLEPVALTGSIAPVGQQPVRLRQAAQQRRRARVVADLSSGHEEPDRPALRIGDGMQLGVHAPLGATYLTRAPPFFTHRLEAVRCAFR